LSYRGRCAGWRGIRLPTGLEYSHSLPRPHPSGENPDVVPSAFDFRRPRGTPGDVPTCPGDAVWRGPLSPIDGCAPW